MARSRNGNRRGRKPGSNNPGRGETVSRTGAVRDLAPMFKTPSHILHRHVRRWEYGSLGRAVADQGYAFTFALSDLPNSSEFTSLYDNWRLDMVEMIIELAPLTTSISAVATPVLPTLLITPDYDDGTPPTSISAIEQYGQCERFTFSPSKPSFSRRIVPRMAVALATNASGTLLGGLNLKPDFIDCSFPSSIHFGIKIWPANYNTTTVGLSGAILQVSFRYHFTMRNTR